MANIASAKKDIRRKKKRTVHNNRLRNRTKKAIKQFNTLIENGDVKKAKEILPRISKILDKSSKKSVIKQGNASRRKSRLALKLNKLITASKNVKNTAKSS